MIDFPTALGLGLGLALVIEGCAYALFPNAMKRMMLTIIGEPPSHLRLVGLMALALGVLVVWLVL